MPPQAISGGDPALRRSKRSDRYEANDQPYAGREDWQEAEYDPEDAYPPEDA